ncbi:MAG: TetR/AcrR family transcriptional regulator [Thermomicrobiales bacterium]|nr:TetR/AcrR family transcriptional regulator [Thermomicrobiales bacterium]
MVEVMESGIAATEIEVRGRERVVRKARELFLAQGYAAVSMQQIADAVGVNKATLYHYFRDKQALFIAVMVEQGKQMNTAVGAALAAGSSLPEKLQSVTQTILDMQHSDFGRLANDMHLHVSPEGRAEIYARCGVPWAQISDTLREAAAQGEVRDIDVDLAARGYFGMVVSQRWQRIKDAPDSATEVDLAKSLADLLLHGITSQEATAAS